MCRSIWRVFLAAVFITAAGNVAGERYGSPEGKCYQVNSAGKFESYGEYLWQSKEIVRGRSVGGDIAGSLVQYLRKEIFISTRLCFVSYARAAKPAGSKKVQITGLKIKLPVRILACGPYVANFSLSSVPTRMSITGESITTGDSRVGMDTDWC